MLLEMGEVLRVPCPCHERIRPPLLRLVSMPKDRLARVAGYVAIKTAIDFPPMQAPASFNIQAVKEKVEEAIKAHEGQ